MAQSLPVRNWIDQIPIEGSLEQLLQAEGPPQPGQPHDQHDACAYSLPNSRGSSDNSQPNNVSISGSLQPGHLSGAGQTHASQPDSLSELQNAGGATRRTSSPDAVVAAQIPLSDSEASIGASVDLDSTAAAVLPIHRRRSRRRRTYWQHIERLQRCLPHLKSLSPTVQRFADRGIIHCLDYRRDRHSYQVKDRLSMRDMWDSQTLDSRMLDLRTISDPQIMTRYILVEDLCPALIESLGRWFEIDPEFFAAHLNRSGYAGVDYEDDLPDQWDTCFFSKPYASMKWYRVVQQNPKVTQWLQTPHSILDRRLVTGTNHIRKIKAAIGWADPAYNRDGTRNQSQMEHQAVAGTNIFRRSWSLSTRPSTRQERLEGSRRWYLRSNRKKTTDGEPAVEARQEEHEIQGPRGWKYHSIPTAWEEKASWYHYYKSAVPIFIVLLDPLPQIDDHKFDMHKRSRARQKRSSREPDATTPVEMCYPRIGRGWFTFPIDKFQATREDIDQFQAATQIAKSTMDAILEQASMTDRLFWNGADLDPIRALVTIIGIDTNTLFQTLDIALDEISRDSLDDYLITRRLQDWRKLLSEFEIQVPTIGTGLRTFLEYTFPPDREQSPAPSSPNTDPLLIRLPASVSDTTTDIERRITRMHKRIENAYTALRADMQFAESRRSIAEAKAVTKLTELAFIFIPLSFTCSLFSMSILELQGGVPVWTFVVTALSMALLAYGVRIVITSDLVAESSRKALEQFWERRDVQRGSRVPTFTLVVLTIRELWKTVGAKFATYTLYFSFLIVPIAFLWAYAKLNTGLNAVVTVLFVFGGLGCVWSVAALGSDDWTLGHLRRRWNDDTDSDASSEA